MEKVWLKSYPAGVPAEIDMTAYASLADFFARGVERWGDKVAYINMGVELSYRQVDALSARFAADRDGQAMGRLGAPLFWLCLRLVLIPCRSSAGGASA